MRYSQAIHRQRDISRFCSWTCAFFIGAGTTDVGCLVDSSSDDCVFHSSIAENLGIDLESGQPITHYALGMTPLLCYVHTIELQIFGFDERIQIEASFTRDSEFGVLGRAGFLRTTKLR